MLELDLGIGVAAFDEKDTPVQVAGEVRSSGGGFAVAGGWEGVGAEFVRGGGDSGIQGDEGRGVAMNERIGRMGGDRGDGGAKAKCVG